MKSARAARTFRRSDTGKLVHMDQTIEGEDSYIEELARNRLVRDIKALTGAPENKGNPTPAASVKSSALPAAPASPQTTASESTDGEVKKKRGRPRKVEASS